MKGNEFFCPVPIPYTGAGEACSVFLSEETRDQLRELAQKTALGFDKLVAQAVARMVSDQSAASYGKSPFTSKKSPRKSKRRNSALSSSSGGVSGVNKRRASSGRQSKGAATEPSARDEGRLSRWHELPDPIVRAIHQTLQAHAPGHVRASMLRVCRAWAQQFSLMVTEAPFGLGIHKRQCDWQLCSLDGVSSVARYRNLRMLSLGIHRLPAQRLPAVLARLSRLEMLDLHFPPNFHPTSAEHHRCLAALTVPSLGLQLRSFMLSVSQLNMLQKLPNLHRLCYKVKRPRYSRRIFVRPVTFCMP